MQPRPAPRPRRAHHPSFLLHLAAVTVAALVTCVPAARAATMYAGTWGDDPDDGRVLRYESGTTWTDLSPPSGLGSSVWDLEWSGDLLWAGVGTGGGAGTGGRVYFWDGSSWSDISPAGGFDSPVTSVSAIDGQIYATARDHGLYRKGIGNAWELLGTTDESIGQGFVSSAHEDRPMLYMGEDHFDEFWVHDPMGLMSCGDACPTATGELCPAGCYGNSCIYSFTDFDDGSGPGIYSGAWFGAMYKWSAAARRFIPSDEIGFNHIQGLASYQGDLWVGDAGGDVWSTPDGSSASKTLEAEFGIDWPVSDMLTVESDDLLWIAFGGVPFGFARRNGLDNVRTYDGTSFVDRGVTGGFRQGVIALLAVVADPEIVCDAGAEQTAECAGAATPVILDGSATEIIDPGALTATYTWTGAFIEGTADGVTPTVTFAGPGDHVVTLTVGLGSLTESCETTVHVVDTQPPIFGAVGVCLWPPNHRYRCFGVEEFTSSGTATALDECQGTVSVRFVGASSTQPEDDTPGGDGHTNDDIIFDDAQLCVRGERQGGDGDGRTYEVLLEAVDASGNVTVLPATLFVPHDQRELTRCPGHSVGLRPNVPPPIGPGGGEGTYPPALRPPRR